MGHSFCMEQEEGLYTGDIAMMDGMFELLIAGVQSDPESMVLPRKPSVSYRGCDTPGSRSCQQGPEFVLESDGLGKCRGGFGGAFYTQHETGARERRTQEAQGC